jgi:enoyl-CoA hydratase
MIDHHATGDDRILVETQGHVACIKIARPEKLNALDFPMVQALERAAELVDGLQHIRATVLTGAGEKSFCAGGDIEAWASWSAQEFALRWVKHGHRAFDALARMRMPTIAALNGHCLGGGLELALTADFRIAEDHIKIGLPETGLGIIPGWSGTQRAVRRFGPQLVRRMALGGEIFDAKTANELGLVDKLVPKFESFNAAMAYAQTICTKSPNATALAKMLLNAAEGEEREAALEAMGGFVAAASEELATGLAAFRAKTKPVFE